MELGERRRSDPIWIFSTRGTRRHAFSTSSSRPSPCSRNPAQLTASYLIVSYFMSESLTVIIVIILSSAFDFWTVKNVTGRLLVGLKWQTQKMPDGSEKWIYQCRVDESKNDKVDANVFWIGQGVATTFWALFSFLNIIRINIFWAAICVTGFMLTGTNFYAFFKCSRTQKKRLKGGIDKLKYNMAQQGAQMLANNVMNNV